MRPRLLLLFVVLVIVAAAVVGVAQAATGSQDTANGLESAANVIAAGLTLIAAYAAMRSAASAETTARRATEALARTIRPLVGVSLREDPDRPGSPLIAELSVGPGHDAVDVTLAVHLSTGRTVHLTAPHLNQWRASTADHGWPSVDLITPAPAYREQAAHFGYAVLEYSDVQHAGRWREILKPYIENPGMAEELWHLEGETPELVH